MTPATAEELREREAALRAEIAALPRSDYPTVACIRQLLEAHLDDTIAAARRQTEIARDCLGADGPDVEAARALLVDALDILDGTEPKR